MFETILKNLKRDGTFSVTGGGNLIWSFLAIIGGVLFGTFFMAFHSAQGPQLGLPARQLLQQALLGRIEVMLHEQVAVRQQVRDALPQPPGPPRLGSVLQTRPATPLLGDLGLQLPTPLGQRTPGRCPWFSL